MCCAPAGTECPDLNSYKTATEVWWQSKAARVSNKNHPTSKKKRKSPSFPLVGEPKKASFDRQKMKKLETRMENATLSICQNAITRAGAERTSNNSPEK